MILFVYHDNPNEGDLKAGMPREEVRKILNSYYRLSSKGGTFKNCTDAFGELSLHTLHNIDNKLIDIEIFTGNIFEYKCIDFFTTYSELVKALKEKKINYVEEDAGITIIKDKLSLYVPDMDYEPDAEIKSVYVNLEAGCSVSLLRLESNHIPSKMTYEGSNVDPMDGPAVRMDYEDLKYFSSHGKSKDARHYREVQKKLVQAGRVMDAIKMDIDDIKSKSRSKYLRPLLEVKKLALTMNSKDFIKKQKNRKI